MEEIITLLYDYTNFITIIFIIIVHYNIIKNEFKYNKIPNKLLLTLLFWNIFYLIINQAEIYFLATTIKLLLLSFIILILYKFKIWNSSYLKYIFVTSIFFLWVLEMTYISNIFFMIFIYIISYFFFFYWKIIINPVKLKSYIIPLKQKTKWDIHNWVLKNKNFLILKSFTIILWFLSVFIIIRVIRIYLQWELIFLNQIITVNNITINTIVLILFVLMSISFILHSLYTRYLLQNYKYLIFIILWTIWFLTYELIYDYEFISGYLHRILTFLIFIFITIMIIFHMWKYLFFDNDSKIIKYTELKKWNIIDKKILKEYLVWQKSLENDDILWFINKINNPINKQDCDKLKMLIKKNSDYQKKKNIALPPNIIRIYNTFNFSIFIFWSFIITLFVWHNLLINSIIFLFNKIMWDLY